MTEQQDAKDKGGSAETLLPCPFCGGAAKLIEYSISSFVKCTSCNATTDDIGSRAIAAWNRRAAPVTAEAASVMLEALRAAKQQLKPIMTKADMVVFRQIDAAIASAEAAGISAATQ